MASEPSWSSAVTDGQPSSNAVEVRRALATCASIRLEVAGVAAELTDAHAVLPTGTVVVAVDAMTPLGGSLVAVRGADGAVRLDVTHLVPAQARTLARVALTGRVGRFDPAALDSCDDDAVMALLDLPPVALWAIEPDSVRVEHLGTAVEVPVASYRAARPVLG